MRRLPTALVALSLLAGCGGEGGDLLAYNVQGGVAGKGVRIRVTGDGRGSCNGSELREITSRQLIDAREVEREVKDLAEQAADIGEPGGDRRTYELRTKNGTVTWVEGDRRTPPELGKAALLELELARTLCR